MADPTPPSYLPGSARYQRSSPQHAVPELPAKPDDAQLRALAEEILAKSGVPNSAAVDPSHLSLAAAVHELNVRHIELQMHSETLQRSQGELTAVINLNRAIFSSCPMPLILCDEHGHVIEFNDMALLLLDRRPVPNVPVLFDGLWDVDSRTGIQRLRRDAITNLSAGPFAATMRDGRVIELSCRSLRDPRRGRIFLMSLVDVSEREMRIAELDRARLQAVQGEQAKRTLLAMAGHELRTPLIAIQAALDMLDDLAKEPSDREILSLARAAMATELSEIEGLLDTSRLEAGGISIEQRPFLASDVLTSAIESVSMAHRDQLAHILFVPDGSAPLDATTQAVVGDGLRIRQILVNLLAHACQRAPAASKVIARSRCTAVPDDALRLRIRFEIVDQGPGAHALSSGDLPEDRSGSFLANQGLGLSVAHALAERMAGRIGESHATGHGTTLWLELECPRSSTFESQLPKLPDLGTREFWVVIEDDAESQAVCSMLHHMGLLAFACPHLDALSQRLRGRSGRRVALIDHRLAVNVNQDVSSVLAQSDMHTIELLPIGQRTGVIAESQAHCLRPITPLRLLTAMQRVHQVTLLQATTPNTTRMSDDRMWNDMQALIDAMPEHVAVMDRFGVIRAVNRRWHQFACQNDGDTQQGYLGANYLEACWKACAAGDEHALRVATGLKEVLSGRRDAFANEYPCHSPTEQRWFIVYASPLRNRKGEPSGAIVTHLDITRRRMIAEDQERMIRELRDQLALLMNERQA